MCHPAAPSFVPVIAHSLKSFLVSWQSVVNLALADESG